MRVNRKRTLTLVGFILVIILLCLSLMIWSLIVPASVSVPNKPRKEVPLDCRLVLVDTKTRIEALRKQMQFEQMGDFQQFISIIRGLYNNPLVASRDYVKIEIENTSNEPISIYQRIGRLFWTQPQITDSSGNAITIGNIDCSNSLKSLSPRPDDPYVCISPGEIITEPVDLLRIKRDSKVPPGKYAIRVRCTYLRKNEAEEEFLESQACIVDVTEQDIRNYNDLYEKE